jgi:hypothetical protein
MEDTANYKNLNSFLRIFPMLDNLSPESSEKIRDLCRKISVAHNIDEEIQQELFSHMENKFLGYLSGEEKITEDDAFILVREHFGDPIVIRELLQGIHPVESDLGLLRKIGAVTAATISASIVVQGLWLTLRYLLPNNPSWITHVMIVKFLIGMGQSWGPILVLGIVLVIWRKLIANGGKLWFNTYSPDRFIAVLVGLVLLFIFIYMPREKPPSEWEHAVRNAVYAAYTLGVEWFQCMLWLWWFDKEPRRYRSILIGVLAWIGYIEIYTLISFAGSGAFKQLANPIFHLLAASSILFTASISTGLYLLVQKLGPIRDRIVERISR